MSAISEFDLIRQYFVQQKIKNSENTLSIGDDCALMAVPTGYELAITMDTMVEGVHFFPNVNPEHLGHKLLAVNLSDLAAMGATPVSFSLALTMPKVNQAWLTKFSKGLFNLATQFSVDLIGGDTTSGALTLTIQAMGLISEGQAMLRSNAKVGDLIFVTGNMGDAGLGLKIEGGYQCASPEKVLGQFHQPMPKVEEGQIIKNYANACIDLSDGIASDLKHILKKSHVGAQLDWDKIPLSEEVSQYIQSTGDWQMPLSAGEDYELCFTVSPDKIDRVKINCTQIGVIEEKLGLRIHRLGKVNELKGGGYEHFS